MVRMTARRKLFATLFAALGALSMVAPSAAATEFEERAATANPDLEFTPEQRKQAREAELEAIRRTIAVSERRQAALKEEIEGLRKRQRQPRCRSVATGQRLRAHRGRHRAHRDAARPAARTRRTASATRCADAAM